VLKRSRKRTKKRTKRKRPIRYLQKRNRQKRHLLFRNSYCFTNICTSIFTCIFPLRNSRKSLAAAEVEAALQRRRRRRRGGEDGRSKTVFYSPLFARKGVSKRKERDREFRKRAISFKHPFFLAKRTLLSLPIYPFRKVYSFRKYPSEKKSL